MLPAPQSAYTLAWAEVRARMANLLSALRDEIAASKEITEYDEDYLDTVAHRNKTAAKQAFQLAVAKNLTPEEAKTAALLAIGTW